MQEKSLIKRNILQYIDIKGITKYKFYQETGITRGVLDQNNGMSEDNTARILAYFPEINPEWLITGNGPMLRSEIIKDTKSYEAKEIVRLQPNDVVEEYERKGIPLIPVAAFAGIARGEVNVLEYECERYVIPMFKEAEFMIQVKGSSMIPKYSSGDIVACKKLSLKDIFFQWNKVYVLDTDQGVLVKRIHRSSDPDFIKIVSENPQYEPFDLHLSKIHAIAIVIGVVRLE